MAMKVNNRSRRNTIFSGARSIQLRDGSELTCEDMRTMRTIIHHQLHTHERKFTNKTKQPPSRGKAANPHKGKVKNNPPPPKQVDFNKEMGQDKAIIRYH